MEITNIAPMKNKSLPPYYIQNEIDNLKIVFVNFVKKLKIFTPSFKNYSNYIGSKQAKTINELFSFKQLS